VIPRLPAMFDEPFADSSQIPTYLVSELARRQVTVSLSGDGGDELFAGYTRYRKALEPRPWRWIPRTLRRSTAGALATRLPLDWPGRNRLYEIGNMHREFSPDWMGIYPYIRERIYSPAMRAELGGRGGTAVLDELPRLRSLDRLSRLQYVDTTRYLPDDILVKVDRTTMAHSLESRAPLLDHVLVSYVATLPPEWKLRDGTAKYLFRKMIGRHLPASILEKKKQGFAIPRETWFRSDLREHARERLLDPRAIARGYFDRRVLEQVLTYHAQGRRDYSGWIWCLLVLEEWHRAYVDADTRR
jgi:asparagine synthase (glutamine-hydrolysing)